MYKCSKCGKEVKVDSNGNKLRTCTHVDSVIIADCSSKLVGKAKIK